MVVAWYYAHDGAHKGPVSRDDLRLALIGGEIHRLSLVWCEGMPHWQVLESIEELQSLLEPPAPPPVPREPAPPLQAPAPPAPAPAAPVPQALASTAVAPQAPAQPVDAAADARDDSNREPSETVTTRMLEKAAGGFGSKIGEAVWEWLFGGASAPHRRARQVVTFVVLVLVPSATVGSYYIGNRSPAVAMGQVRIDANPWGQVEWVRGPGGAVDLPETPTTPFLMTLPVGNYQAQINYPDAQAPQRCDLHVQPDQVATCWLDLAPVDAKSYFQKIGW